MKFKPTIILSTCIITLLFFCTDLYAEDRDPYQREYVEGEVLVKFKPYIRHITECEDIVENIFGSEVHLKQYFSSLSKRRGQQYMLLESRNKKLTTKKMIEFLEENENIDRIQLNYIYRMPSNPKTKWSIKRSADESLEMVIALLDTGPDYPRKSLAEITKWINPTASNEQTKYLSGDFTDTDGDGMTDVAELKYGFDPNDLDSFPTEPDEVVSSNVPITGSGIGAEYEIGIRVITIRWNNPEQGSYSLTLYNGDQQIYYGGHYSDYAPVNYSEFNLDGTEVLVGHFTKYGSDNQWVADYPEFTIDLSTISFPEVGDPANKISYTFEDFPSEEEQAYRQFLKRVFPLMYYYLGPPAETFNCVITNMGSDSDYFMIVDDGRTFLTDTSFIPRLIAHEFVHAWKGHFIIATDENWNYDPTLTGFEEATAEGMAFEIMHEYVRSYPNDPASIQLLDWRPYQYWSSETIDYDSIKHTRGTAGDFWDPQSLVYSKYSIAATTWQIMMKESPNAYKEMMQVYFDKINNNSTWRSNREDILDIWAEVIPYINGIETRQYLNTIPVFKESYYDEGIYIFSVIRPYGSFGDQQFATSYANKDGKAWWGILQSNLDDYNLPDWVSWMYSDPPDAYVYINTQDQPFTVDLYNYLNEKINSYPERTEILTDWILGYGWKMVEELDMANFPVGLYKETVTFDSYIGYDFGAREDFYFFGLDSLNQDQSNEYIIMIGVDGVPNGRIGITIEDIEYTESIANGAAVFRSDTWPFDLEGKIPVVISNDNGDTHTYYRTIIEAGTIHNFFQHQFIIIDKDFNGIEDHLQSMITGYASSMTSDSATLNGAVNPNGISTECYFEYGTDTSYGSTTGYMSVGSGTSHVSISADLTGLNPDTTYHFRLVATNGGGTSYGEDQTFTTTTTASLEAPTVTTGSATSVTSGSVTLNGSVYPNGLSTTYYFEYGADTSYGSTTTEADMGSGTEELSVSADLTGLSEGTTYHFRLVATNGGGTSYGEDGIFATATDGGSSDTESGDEGAGDDDEQSQTEDEATGPCFIGTAVY